MGSVEVGLGRSFFFGLGGTIGLRSALPRVLSIGTRDKTIDAVAIVKGFKGFVRASDSSDLLSEGTVVEYYRGNNR